VKHWIPSGSKVARELEALLEAHGRPLGTFKSICDFGCGSGRVIGQLRTHPEARLHGMDVDAEAIAWLRSHGEGIHARVNPPEGPAPFADGSFDLICSISIFTHLNARSQRIWLAEVARLLRPGGLAVLTVLGERLLSTWAEGNRPGITHEQRVRLLRAPPLSSEGFIFARENRTRWNAWRYRGVEEDYGLAFWDPEALRAAWSEWFEVENVVPQSINWRQDAVLLGLRPARRGP
jgi:SAM-dependent methyltransferase